MSKTISICGTERGDIPYYLAVTLSNATHIGNPVLVIDNSYSHDIYGAVTDDEQNKEYVIKQNITYIKNALINKDYEGMFDYVIIWHGMNIKEEILKNSDYIYVVPDYTRVSLNSIKAKITDLSEATAVIMRDSVMSNKLSEKTVAKKLGIEEQKIAFSLIYDNKDYENYLAFIYNGRQTFGNLSPIFNECMTTLVAQILEIDIKEASKIYKRAKTA